MQKILNKEGKEGDVVTILPVSKDTCQFCYE